jgi:non-heme chloroperoxidase
MAYMNVGREGSMSINLYYEDHGHGHHGDAETIVLIHGGPLDSCVWERQIAALVESGHRVLVYDRRGFGKSSKPDAGYDFDTLAQDLHRLLRACSVNCAMLVGFGSGAGDVLRYLGTYGDDRVSKAALISPLLPFLLPTINDHDTGDAGNFLPMKGRGATPRVGTPLDFLHNAYNLDVWSGSPIDDALLQAQWLAALAVCPLTMNACVEQLQTDFRDDLRRIAMPVLVIHGSGDKVLQIDRAAVMEQFSCANAVRVDSAPHGLIWSHAALVNKALRDFCHDP